MKAAQEQHKVGTRSLKKISKTARGRAPGIQERIFLSILIIFPFVLASLGFYIYIIIRDLPDVHSLKDYRPSITTRIYGENDRLIDEFFLEDRRLIAIAKLPKYVTSAFVAAEDSRFFQHKGIDFQGMLRAFIKNLEHGAIVQGGSTITQQVAKVVLSVFRADHGAEDPARSSLPTA